MSSITKMSFNSGETIFLEGDTSSDFYIIESGEVHIMTNYKAGQQIIVAKLKSGDSFGEMALIDNAPRTASAVAHTDCKIMKISEESYDMMLNELPIWASSVMRSFSSRLNHMNDTLKALTEAIKRGKY